MATATADLCDKFIDVIQLCEPVFMSFGRSSTFEGRVTTLRVFEDNSMVRTTLEGRSEGGVLVVDGGGSLKCALVGDRLAQLAIDNGWKGVVVFGCIRDSSMINNMEIGIKALNAIPLKSVKRGEGQKNVEVTFASVTFTPGNYLYADGDGIVVAREKLVE